MTTTDEYADELAESACALVDSGPWSPLALDDVLTTAETLLGALAERLHPDAAQHLAPLQPCLARVRKQLLGDTGTTAVPAQRRAQRRKIGLGLAAGKAFARASKA